MTIPVAAITATKYSDWDAFQKLVNSCTSYPNGYDADEVYEPSTYYNQKYVVLANCALCCIYTSILSLMLTVVYYLSRPPELSSKDISARKKLPHLPAGRVATSNELSEADINANFRIWWKRGRILLVCILVATIAAVVSLMFVVNVYYQTFFSFSDQLCDGTESRTAKFTFGYWFLLAIFLICFYIVI